ncbi:hypothetical protein BH24ACT5_BH24ACT5_01060 [soil metagenome]
MSDETRRLVAEYVEAVSTGDFERLTALVHPEATFGGTVVSETAGGEAFVQGFRNLWPITVRIDVREMVVTEDHAVVLYDFVTDTPAGSVLSSEFLSVDGGRIRSSILLFDWRRWPEVIAELKSRMAMKGEA